MEKAIVLNGVDVSRGMSNCNNNRQFYLRMLFKFKDSYSNIKSQIYNLSQTNDVSGVKRLLHTLKGLLNTLGAFEIAKKVQHVENTGVQACITDADYILLNEIYLYLESLFSEIQSLQDASE